MWRLIKSNQYDVVGVSPLKKAGPTHGNAKDKADSLNEQFCSFFTVEDAVNIPDLGPSPYPDMPNIEVMSNGVKRLLQNQNSHKAAGPDDIPCCLLTLLAQEIALQEVRLQ